MTIADHRHAFEPLRDQDSSKIDLTEAGPEIEERILPSRRIGNAVDARARSVSRHYIGISTVAVVFSIIFLCVFFCVRGDMEPGATVIKLMVVLSALLGLRLLRSDRGDIF